MDALHPHARPSPAASPPPGYINKTQPPGFPPGTSHSPWLRMFLAALTLPASAARIPIRLLDDYPGGECLLIILQTIGRDFSS